MRSYIEDVDFETIKQRFDAFWDREVLERPLIHITAPRKPRRVVTLPAVKTIEEKWTSIDYVLKKVGLYFESTAFLGDTIPEYWPNLGSNQIAAFLGGELVFLGEHTSWVPGAGSPPMSKWIHVCRRILDAGRCLHISCEPWEVKILLEKLRHKGLFLQTWCRSEEEAYKVLKIAEKYGR